MAGTTVAAYSNTKDAAGKYGCYFGLSVTGGFGRFIPDHFVVKETEVTDAQGKTTAIPYFTPSCAGGSFSYMGQPFSLSATIEARNLPDPVSKLGTKTVNYFWDPVAKTGLGKAVVGVQVENNDSGTPISDAFARAGVRPFGRRAATLSLRQVSRVWQAPMAPMTRSTSV